MRDLIQPSDNQRPSQDVQSAAEAAALDLGLTVSQAARFAAATLRHLEAGRPVDALERLLDAPDDIIRLTGIVDHAIENAATNRKAALPRDATGVSLSFLEGLPCAVTIFESEAAIEVDVALHGPSRFATPDYLSVPDPLWARLAAPKAGRSPRIGHGASLMQL